MKETWILYQTTNNLNGKIYVGVHKVADTVRSRNYLGSGDRIRAAIKKYGKENFVRCTLAEFSLCKDVYAAEAEVVNKEFVNRLDTYNICFGGRGGVNFTEEMKIKLSIAKKESHVQMKLKPKLALSTKVKLLLKKPKQRLGLHIEAKSATLLVKES